MVLALAWLFAFDTLAQGALVPQPTTGAREDTLHIWNGVAAGLNPLVLGDMLKVYRKMPFGSGDTFLTSDSHFRVGALTTVCPTFFRPAILVGFSPWLFLDIDLHAGPGLNFLHYTFHSYDEDASPGARADKPYGFGMFFQATVNVLLKLAVWRLLLLDFVDINAFYAHEPFYHWEMDTIIRSGFDTRNRTFIGFEVFSTSYFVLSYEVYRYHESGWRTQWVAAGLFILGSLPGGTSVIFQVGQHLENDHFDGARIYLALFWDFDFPLHHKD